MFVIPLVMIAILAAIIAVITVIFVEATIIVFHIPPVPTVIISSVPTIVFFAATFTFELLFNFFAESFISVVTI